MRAYLTPITLIPARVIDQIPAISLESHKSYPAACVTEMLFEEPNPTGSRPSDLIEHYQTTETPQRRGKRGATKETRRTERRRVILFFSKAELAGISNEIVEFSIKGEIEASPVRKSFFVWVPG